MRASLCVLAVIAASVLYLQAAAAARAAVPENGSGWHKYDVRALRHDHAGYRTVLHVTSGTYPTAQSCMWPGCAENAASCSPQRMPAARRPWAAGG